MKLRQFYEDLQDRWAGSLVKVQYLDHPHAKEYMYRLAREGLVENVAWGWYWVPAQLEDVWDFLANDKNFKVIAGQTAASLWNGDFVHRELYLVKVKDRSYGQALKAFGEGKGWDLEVEVARKPPAYTKIDGLLVETIDETILDCLSRWAFLDAFAILHEHPEIDFRTVAKQGYWQRLPGTHIRLKPVLEYGYSRLTGRKSRPLADPFVAREVEEAVEKVMEIG